MIAQEISELAGRIGNLSAICSAMDLARATYYRLLETPRAPKRRTSAQSSRALTPEEKAAVIDILHEIRFVDKSPAAIVAALLDEGRYVCSESTMYRILRSLNEVVDRRRSGRQQKYDKPELIATGPNQVWSWDITKVKGPQKGSLFYVYVIIDIYSRYVVGWLIAEREKSEIAKYLIEETCSREQVNPHQLTIHSDRGSSMNSQLVADLLVELGVVKSLNRPHVSNDNPYSESQFSTLKSRPEFPDRFGSIEDARSFCTTFFRWYNREHYHSGIAMLTPHMVQRGKGVEILRKRNAVMLTTYKRHPERFVRGLPRPFVLPEAAWINPPAQKSRENNENATISDGTFIGSVR